MSKSFIYILLIAICLSSCDDMHDFSRITEFPEDEQPTRLYILCEGLFNMNNSTLARYDLVQHSIESDFFLAQNKRGLGDTANEMEAYDNKLFILVNVSSQLEIIDLQSGMSIKQIALFDENQIARQPRHIIFQHDKAYITCFDGNVLRLDLTSLELDGICPVGRNPEGLCIANHKLYVANSGGLDYPNYDNTISVIDLSTFKEMKRITVAANPGSLFSDSQGDVYISSRGDYTTKPYLFQRIDSDIDQLVESFDNVQALQFVIVNDYAYIYNYDYNSQQSWVKVFDCLTEKIIKENFITDGTTLNTPFGIDINSKNGDIFITDAYNFVIWGDVLCFSSEGKLKYRLSEVGLNPNNVIIIPDETELPHL